MTAENLTFKNIREFTPEDTFYTQEKEHRGSGTTLLCQFVKFEEKGTRVHGRVIKALVNPSLYENRIKEGWNVDVVLRNASLYGEDSRGHTRYHSFDPTGFAAYPTPEDRYLGVPKEHPTYGIMSICKTHCSGANPLFGSSIQQPTYISISIKRAELKRSLHEDRYYAHDEIIRVAMSPLQFAEMITTPNSEGTPVTIERLLGEGCGDTPFVAKIEQFHSEFEDKVEKINADAKQAATTIGTILEKPSITKSDREHIRKLLEGITREIESNLPFLREQFSEQMDRSVAEAKSALNEYLQSRGRDLGLPQGSVEAPLMLGDTKRVDSLTPSDQ